MVNCGIYVFNTIVDCPPMSSTITILDTDEEVIDVDASQDAIIASNASNDDQTIVTVDSEDNCQATQSKDDSSAVEEKVEIAGKLYNSESCECMDTSKPLFKVMFRDESVSRKYREKIKEFFEKLVRVKECGTVYSELVLEIWGEDASKNENLNSITGSDDSLEVICDNPLFTMSNKPTFTDTHYISKSDIPTYEKKYHETVNETGLTKLKNEPKKNYAPTKNCFNCTGDHNLKDCLKPRNQVVINKNRKDFNLKINSKAFRYHLHDDQRFGHLIPGKLSKNLRRALGIKENELPKHIYRMRTLGYPPGWLEEARLQHSGLSLFNSDGLKEIEPNGEPGVVNTETNRDQYDIKKIYDFPGFNVPAPPDTHDDYKHYWVPHIQAAHSKKTMLLLLSGKQMEEGYKRKKLKLCTTTSSDNANCEPSEMEVVDVDESVVETVPVTGHFVPPLPKDSPVKVPLPQSPPPPPPPPPLPPPPSELPTQSPTQSPAQPSPQVPADQATFEDSECQVQDLQSPDSAVHIDYQPLQDGSATPSSRPNSPSLFDLESMKKQILVELEDSSSQSNSDSAAKVIPSTATSSKLDMPPPSTNTSVELNNSLNTSDTESTNRGSIISVDFGTPVLQSTSPYSKLPSSEKFSKNICDVINFENLPDSTGKYKQMTGVIRKVRRVLAKIQKE